MLGRFDYFGDFLWRLLFVSEGDGCDGGDADGGGVGAVELCFIGATLQLRGAKPVSQPPVAQSGTVLVYNGIAVELDIILFHFSSLQIEPFDVAYALLRFIQGVLANTGNGYNVL